MICLHLDEKYTILETKGLFNAGNSFFEYVNDLSLDEKEEISSYDLVFKNDKLIRKTLFLKKEKGYLVVILDNEKNFDDAFVYYDVEKDVIKVDGVKKQLEGNLEDILDKKKNFLRIHLDDYERFCHELSQLIQGNSKNISSFRSRFGTSSFHWYKFELSPFAKKDFFTGRLKNIDDIIKERDRVVRKSILDPLTNVMQKDAITTYIIDLLENKPKQNILMGLFDIDYFKNINDAKGHLFGDYIIARTATIVKECIAKISKSAKIGRVGGDEFLFVIENVDSRDDIVYALRSIRQVLDELTLADGTPFKISVTIGTVSYPQDGADFETLFKKVDKALYRGKTKGRDCYIIYEEAVHGKIEPNKDVLYIDAKNSQGVKLSNNTFTSQCLDLLLESNDLRTDVLKVMERICDFSSIDRILFVSIRESVPTIPFKWVVKPEFEKGIENYYNLDYRGYDKNFEADNMFYVNERQAEKIKNPIRYEVMSAVGSNACFQAGVFQEKNLIGFITFDIVRVKKRIWARDEMFFLSILSKVLNTFIEKLSQEEKYNEKIFIDNVTNCWNLVKFKDITKDLICKSHGKMMLVSLDLNEFKKINDNYGYCEGDIVLLRVSNTIKENIKPNEALCRVSDDKFLLLLEYKTNEKMVERLQDLNDQIALVKTTKGVLCNLNIKAGGKVIEKEESFISTMDKAVSARKFGKRITHRLFEAYNYDIERIAIEEKNIEERMNFALANEEYVVYFQPCYNVRSGKISTLEALVRWQYEGKLIPPGKFIPLFEKNGFIIELDFYVYEVVCRTLRKWLDEGLDVYPVSVNVSRCHIFDDQFVKRVSDLLKKYKLETRYLCLELTESLFVDNEEKMVKFVEKIKKAGFAIYMDDFGVAYSNLNLLSKIPVDVIKLDKSFFDSKSFDKKERIIINNIIRMAKELNIDVLSEGIEEEYQVKELKDLDCDYAQGFFFDHPMPISDFEDKYLK